MKRRLLLLFSLVLALLLPLTSLAEGLTLRTVSIFAGADAAADTYTRLLKEWEEKTGNRVSDTSTPSNEEWKNRRSGWTLPPETRPTCCSTSSAQRTARRF